MAKIATKRGGRPGIGCGGLVVWIAAKQIIGVWALSPVVIPMRCHARTNWDPLERLDRSACFGFVLSYIPSIFNYPPGPPGLRRRGGEFSTILYFWDS